MRVIRLATLALIIAATPPSIECVACSVVVTETTAWERMARAIETIRNDPKTASLEAAGWWCDPLDALRAPPEGQEEEAAEMEAFLTLSHIHI